MPTVIFTQNTLPQVVQTAQANLAYDQANTALNIANLAYAESNTANALAQSAYTQANSAYGQANIAMVTGDNATIAADAAANVAYAAYNEANNAYGQANLAYAQANNEPIAHIVYGVANNAYGTANLAYQQANLAIELASNGNTFAQTIVFLSNAAYGQANAAYAQANLAYAQANAEPTAQAAFAQANNAFQQANLVASIALDATTLVIEANAYAQSVYTFAASIGANANLAYAQANTAYGRANLAYSAANTANITAQTGITLAISANTFAQTLPALISSADANGQSGIALAIAANTYAQTFPALINLANVSGQTGISLAIAANNYAQTLPAFITIAQNTAQQGVTLAVAANTFAQTLPSLITIANTTGQTGISLALTANITGQAAFTLANTANNTGNLAYGQANSAYSQSNVANALAQTGVTLALAGNTFAQSTFTLANTANTTANLAYSVANLAVANITSGNIANLVVTGTTNNVVIDTRISQGANISLLANNLFAVTNANLNFINTSTITVSLTNNVAAAANGSRTGDISLVANGTILGIPAINSALNTMNTSVSTSLNTMNASVSTSLNTLNINISTANTTGQTGIALAVAANVFAQTLPTLIITANTQANLARAQSNTANTLAQSAYTQANSAYAQANLVYGQANAAYGQANLAYAQANAALNTISVSANGGSTLSGQPLNFVNTSTVLVSIANSGGVSNISFIALGAGGNGGGNGSVLQVSTGTGLTGGPITTIGTVSANIANTTVQGVTLLIDSISSTDAGNAATANSVRTLYNNVNTAIGSLSTNVNTAIAGLNTFSAAATSAAYGQANAAYGQANLAYGQANSAFAEANTANGVAQSAYTQANTANTVAQSAVTLAGTANVTGQTAFTLANTANTTANLAYTQANNAFNVANAASASILVAQNSGTIVANASGITFNNSATTNITVSANGTKANITVTTNTAALSTQFLPLSGGTLSGGVTVPSESIASGVPILYQNNISANANTQLWDTYAGIGGLLSFEARNDLQTNVNPWLVVNRANGTSNISGITIGNNNDLPNIAIDGSIAVVNAVVMNVASSLWVAASGNTSANLGNLTNRGMRTFLGKDAANNHWFVTYDAVNGSPGEANSLSYGFTSNGTIISHMWNMNGNIAQQMNYGGGFGGGIPTLIVPGTVRSNIVTVLSSSAQLIWQAQSPPANTGFWTSYVDSVGTFRIQARNDNQSNGNDLYFASRANGTTNITSITYGNSTDNPSHTFNGNVMATGPTASGYYFFTGGATPNGRMWSISTGTGGNFNIFAKADNLGNGAAVLTATRGANTSNITGISYGNPQDLPPHTFFGNILGTNVIVSSISTSTINSGSFFTAAGLDVVGQANAAYGQANLAYAAANATGTTVSTYANGTIVLAKSNLNFNNTNTVNVSVTANGTTQSNIAFTVNVPFTSVTSNSYTSAANQSVYTLSANVTGSQYVLVTVNGLLQIPGTDYNVVGNNILQFTANNNVNDVVEARIFSALQIGVGGGGSGSGANVVSTYANGTIVAANANVNFNNTATVNVIASANGTLYSNVGFTVNSQALGFGGVGANVAGNMNVTATVNSVGLYVGTTSVSLGGVVNRNARTYLGKDGANNHWLATSDNLSEPNNLGYGFNSNGVSIVSHTWIIGGNTNGEMVYQYSSNVATLTIPGNYYSNGYFINGGFDVTGQANNAYGQANLAYNSANSALALAANAYNLANNATGVPGGANGQIQFNNNGSFGGAANITYNTAAHMVSYDANVRVANANYLLFGGAQANGASNSRFAVSFNAAATSLDFSIFTN
jgi:hypothetical protein